MNIGDITNLVTQVTDAIDRHTRAIHARTLYLAESNDSDRGRSIRDDWRGRIEGELRKVAPTSPKKEKPHACSVLGCSGNHPHAVAVPNEAIVCSVDGAYVDAQDSPPTRLKCEECGRIYSWPSGKHIG